MSRCTLYLAAEVSEKLVVNSKRNYEIVLAPRVALS